MSVTRILAQNTGVQIIGKVISTLIGVFIVALMTRELGQVGFGMYSTASAFLQFFTIILDFGLNVMIVQLLSEAAGDLEKEKRIVSATFTFRTISALVLLSIAPVIALFFPYPIELKIAIFALWASFFTASLNQIVIGVQQRHFKMHIVAISEVAGRVFLLGGVLLAHFLHWGLIPIVLIVSIGGVVNFGINFIVARKYASFEWNWDPAFWRILLKRSWPIGMSIMFNLIYFKADTLILSWTHSQAEVGIYSAAYRVLEILITIPFMFAGVLLPIIARSWAQGDRQRFSKLLGRSYDAIIILAAPLVAGTFVLANRGMEVVAGKDFIVSGDILRVLIVAIALIFVGTISSHAIVALDAQRAMLPFYIGIAVLTLIGYLALIPRYGMWAAAWLTVFSEACVTLASTILTIKRSDASWKPTVALKAIFAAVFMALVILPFQNTFLLWPVLLGGCTYGVLILATGAVSRETLKDVLSFRTEAAPVDVFKP